MSSFENSLVDVKRKLLDLQTPVHVNYINVKNNSSYAGNLKADNNTELITGKPSLLHYNELASFRNLKNQNLSEIIA